MSKSGKPIADSDVRNPRRKTKTWGSFGEYAELIRWLVPDVVRHGGLRIFGVMLLSVASVAARAATVGAVVLFVRAQAEGKPVVLLERTLPSDPSLLGFAVWGGAALGFAMLDVGARLWADRINFRISESYAEVGMQRLLRHIAAGGTYDPPEEIKLPNRYPLVGIMQLDMQRVVRVVVQALSLPTPLITFLVVAGVLLTINAVLTLVLLPIFGAYSLAVAAVNRRMLRDSQRRRSAIREVRHDLQGVSMTLHRTRFPSDALPGWLSTFPRKAWMERSIRAFGGMWFARRRVQYLRDGFNGIALLTIVMVFGTLLASNSASWSVVLTYLVALGYGIQSMDKFSRLVTAANRQIPHVRRFVWFMQTHPELPSGPAEMDRRVEAGSPASLQLRVDAGALDHSVDAIELAAGSISYCATDRELESRSIGEMCAALSGGDEHRAAALEGDAFALGRIVRLPERSLAALLPRSSRNDEDRARILAFLDQVGLREEFDATLGDFDTTITEDIDAHASPALRFVIRLLPAVAARARLVFLGMSALSQVDTHDREKILAALPNPITLLVPDDPSEPLPGDAQTVLVVAGGVLCGIGDRAWHEGLREAGLVSTPKWLIEAQQAERERTALDFDDDDDDDED